MRYNFTRKTPYKWIVYRAIELGLDPKKTHAILPRWEKLGDVVLIRLPAISALKPEHHPPVELSQAELEIIGQAVAEVLDVRCVAVDVGRISGELRLPNIKVIYGRDTETVHKENGILYKMDISKEMFSSGNVDERIRMGRLHLTGLNVLDMFAGIGYFTLPVAKYTGAREVFAVEKNPESFRHLRENLELNKVSDRVRAVQGDNREKSPGNWADVVIMGYFGGTIDFFDTALNALNEKGGAIYFHDALRGRDEVNQVIDLMEKKGASNGMHTTVNRVRKVKNYAPNVYHYVIELEAKPQGNG